MQHARKEKAFRIIVGSMVFLSGLLGYTHHPYWLFATMFIGVNLAQSAITGFCPLERILDRL
jgi:hypothetical protein